MDIATHVLLGATAGYALGGQRLGRSAALIGALGASLPDLDILLRDSNDALFTLEFHRHFSHSLIFAVGACIGIGLILNQIFRRGGLMLNILLVLTGYLSAILLDACTSYGTHLFWPFSDQRVALSLISIIDPIFSAVLIVGLFIGLRHKKTTATGVALMLCACYLSVSALQQHRAGVALRQTMATLHPQLTNTLVKPSFGNVLLWRGLAWNDTEIAAAAVRPGLTSGTRVYPGERRSRPQAQQLIAWGGGSNVHRRDVERFAELSAQLLILHPSRPTLLGDARFALLPDSLEPLWGIEVDHDSGRDHVIYVTNRNMTKVRRTRFINMILGRELP